MKFRYLAAAAAAAIVLAGCSPAAPSGSAPSAAGVTTVTFRLWDTQVAAAYAKSFAEFSKQHPDIKVQLNTVAFSDYFTKLPLDVSSGTADDIYWLSSQYFGGLADSKKLIDVGKELAPDVPAWVPGPCSSTPAAAPCGASPR